MTGALFVSVSIADSHFACILSVVRIRCFGLGRRRGWRLWACCSRPYSAGSFVADHAGSNWVFWSACLPEEGASCRFDLAHYDQVALAALLNVGSAFDLHSVFQIGIIGAVFVFQC
jgi:hypothetical protein